MSEPAPAPIVVGGLHELVLVGGGDAVGFLDGLLSQAIAGLDVGQVRRSLLLDPRGRLRAHLRVGRWEDGVVLVADAGAGERVRGDLDRFRLRVDVDLRIGGPLAEVWGPGARDVVAGATGLRVPRDGVVTAGATIALDLVWRRPAPERIVVAGATVDELAAAGAIPVDPAATVATRVEIGEPTVPGDVDGCIPAESGLVEGAVDFDKGCFLGQELVARVATRGRLVRRLRGVVVDGESVPTPGAEVLLDAEPIGVVASAARSERLGRPVALATVAAGAAPGSRVEIVWSGGRAAGRLAELPLNP